MSEGKKRRGAAASPEHPETDEKILSEARAEGTGEEREARKTRKTQKKKGVRARFRLFRFFEKPDFRVEKEFLAFGKKLLFTLLIIAELFVLLQMIPSAFREGRWAALAATVGIEAVLTVSEAVKLFAVRGFKNKICCYIIDFVAAFLLTAVTGSVYLCTLYLIVLTEFYISSDKMLPSAILCAVCMVVYVLTQGVSSWFRPTGAQSFLTVIALSFNDLVVMLVHFLLVNFCVRFYRQYIRLTAALKELDESKAELQKAYDNLAEVTALEERQRIARDIHDTAGHSITTVIMQTEAAKLIIDTRPEEAKSKIIAANLQAKHALEELRESVHLLSGVSEKETLKSALESILNESSDGTGIRIRSDIDDISVSDAKYRFLCNALKEGISNGLRHGGATAFWFELKSAGGKLRFLLSDNGSGVALDSLKEGFGLSGLSGRAESFGGEAWFVSEPEEGFEIHLVLPADPERPEGM